MAKQFHFTGWVTSSGELILPKDIRQQINVGEAINVTLTVHTGTLPVAGVDEPDSLEALVASIKQTPPNPNAIIPATGNLAEGLQQLLQEEPMDEAELADWLAQWDKFEATMKAEDIAHEEAELREIWDDIC